jgi:hypothetical protein
VTTILWAEADKQTQIVSPFSYLKGQTSKPNTLLTQSHTPFPIILTIKSEKKQFNILIIILSEGSQPLKGSFPRSHTSPSEWCVKCWFLSQNRNNGWALTLGNSWRKQLRKIRSSCDSVVNLIGSWLQRTQFRCQVKTDLCEIWLMAQVLFFFDISHSGASK